ncbi:MAG: hypothetical protein JO110_19005 [Acetobacteraceae bacterium]|nr:hypothetical protein [Acetobacteraceae bacterium]
MRRFIPTLLALFPAVSLADQQCPMPDPAAAIRTLDQIPALSRIKASGAQLTDLGTIHGMRTVFARAGEQFQVFYVTPERSPLCADFLPNLRGCVEQQGSEPTGWAVIASLGTGEGLL